MAGCVQVEASGPARPRTDGQTTKVIASGLGLAPSTVRVLVARAASKVHARSCTDLLEKAAVLDPQHGVHANPHH